MTSPTRVLVVGMDAMDHDIARALAAQGSLPVLASLLDDAAWAETVNPVGLLVGGLWPSFSTGVSPARHGFYCFRQLISGRYEVGRFDPYDIRCPPFWTTLSEVGRRCAVIDVPITPIQPVVDGVLVVDWGTHDRMLGFGTWPPELAEEISARFGAHPVTTKCDEYAERRDYRALRADLLAGIERKTDLTAHVLAPGGWDLVVTIFGESHCVGHQLWHLHDRGHPAHDAEQVTVDGDPIEEVYRALDRALGRLLELVDDETHVIVLLSHGMGLHYDGDHLLAEVLRRLEAADGQPPRAIAVREMLLRVAQRGWRIVRPRTRRGVVSTDGSRRYVRVPNNELFGGVRFNVAGREPRGRVQPGAELDALVNRLRADLLDLVNAETGEPVVLEVIRTRDIYEGDALDALPDLLLAWNKASPITDIRSPKIGVVEGTYNGPRTGDHRPPGFLLVRGPSIAPGPIGRSVSVTDLAPTIAAVLGVALPGVDGQPVDELVGNQFSV